MNDELIRDGYVAFPIEDWELHCVQYNIRWSYIYIDGLTRNIIFTDWATPQIPEDLYLIVNRYNSNRHWWRALCDGIPYLLSHLADEESMLRDI